MYFSYKEEKPMKHLSVFCAFILILSLAAPAVFAGQGPAHHDRSVNNHHDRFYDRIENQQKRINQGIKAGELTRREAALLQENLDSIRQRYTRIKSDRKLTKHERERLERMLDRNSAMIKDKKHNPARRLYDDDIDNRIENQQKSIHRGIKSGELTRREADIVLDNLNEIRKKYSRMRRDNILTMREIEKLEGLLDENSRMINRKTHNRDVNIRRLF